MKILSRKKVSTFLQKLFYKKNILNIEQRPSLLYYEFTTNKAPP